MDGLQTEAAVEFVRELMHFLKNIREAPEGRPGDVLLHIQRRFYKIRRGLARVVAVIGQYCGEVPFIVNDRVFLGLLSHGGSIESEAVVGNVLRFRGLAHDHAHDVQVADPFGQRRQKALRRVQLFDRLRVVCLCGLARFTDAGQRVSCVLVCADEVDRNVVFLTKGDKIADPAAAAGGRAAYQELFVKGFDGPRGDLVKAEVFLLRAEEERSAQIGLVPDFKVPALHLFGPIAVQQILDKLAHMLRPRVIILWLREVRAVKDLAGSLALGQRGRHEGKLHQRFHARLQNPVIHGSAVVKGALGKRFASRDGQHLVQPRQRMHIVAKDAVKPHIANPQLVMDEFQLLEIIRPQRLLGMVGADRELPMLVQPAVAAILAQNPFLHTISSFPVFFRFNSSIVSIIPKAGALCFIIFFEVL